MIFSRLFAIHQIEKRRDFVAVDYVDRIDRDSVIQPGSRSQPAEGTPPREKRSLPWLRQEATGRPTDHSESRRIRSRAHFVRDQ